MLLVYSYFRRLITFSSTDSNSTFIYLLIEAAVLSSAGWPHLPEGWDYRLGPTRGSCCFGTTPELPRMALTSEERLGLPNLHVLLGNDVLLFLHNYTAPFGAAPEGQDSAAYVTWGDSTSAQKC